MHHQSQHFPKPAQPWANWLLLGMVLSVVVTSGLVVNSLVVQSDTSRQMEATIARLEHKAHELGALEWQTLHKGKLTAELAENYSVARQEMEAQFAIMSGLPFDLPQIARVRSRYADYLKPLDQEFKHLAAGEIEAAEELDDAKVDPAFSRLSDSLREADAEFNNRAFLALRQVRVWIFVVSFAAAAAMGLLFWQFHQKQKIIAVSATEQRVLQLSNEQLAGEIATRKAAQQRLNEMHAELLKASRHAGMQEVATGVLHNVGNVLNSVNVTAALLREGVGKSQMQNLVKAANLLREHAADPVDFLTNDPRGRRLPGFLIKLSDHLVSEQSGWQAELADLTKNIEHIKEIVTMQQGFARLSGVTENISVEELVNDALRMNEAALERHEISVVREFQAVPQVSVDKHKVLQILINLVRNAKQAAKESSAKSKVLTLQILSPDSDRVLVRVRDNGMGISPENLVRIFQHGFTTKKDGHGFGLHSSVNAAREMGGNLSVESDGPGTGAAFTLELPVAKNTEYFTK